MSEAEVITEEYPRRFDGKTRLAANDPLRTRTFERIDGRTLKMTTRHKANGKTATVQYLHCRNGPGWPY